MSKRCCQQNHGFFITSPKTIQQWAGTRVLFNRKSYLQNNNIKLTTTMRIALK